MTGDRVVCEGIGVIAVIVVAIDIVEETPHVLTQGIIEDQQRVRLRTAYLLGLLQQIRNATVVYTIVQPWRCGEEAGEVSFVSTLEHTAGDVRQAFVVQGNQTCQVILEMLKLAPILKEVPEDIGMRGHEGSGSHDRQLHQALPFHGGGRIGPESIIRKSEMANHNRGDLSIEILMGSRIISVFPEYEKSSTGVLAIFFQGPETVGISQYFLTNL